MTALTGFGELTDGSSRNVYSRISLPFAQDISSTMSTKGSLIGRSLESFRTAPSPRGSTATWIRLMTGENGTFAF